MNDNQKHTLYEKPTLAVIRFTEQDITTAGASGTTEVPEEGELIPANSSAPLR